MLFDACTSSTSSRPESAYAPAGSCRPCHAAIAETYQRVAMARSIYRPTTANIVEDYRKDNRFYHAASSACFFNLVSCPG